jgi:succinate dehydrogenase / fumarate reductase iron-sulfur subunit
VSAADPPAVTARQAGPAPAGADHAHHTIRLVLNVWRQPGPDVPGKLVRYELAQVSVHMSFLEMLDVLNEQLTGRGEDPVAFDHDCREGICGTCGFLIDGVAHGPLPLTTVCQLHMRHFEDGDELTLEPWRSRAFPVVKDLAVNRSAFDRIVAAGGYVSVNTGSAVEANTIPVPKPDQEWAMDAAECIGCGACVAACPNGAAQLFTSAKVAHLNTLPQGQPERSIRVERMVAQMEAEKFGSCTNYRECEAVCPKGISIDFIAQMNRDFLRAKRDRRQVSKKGGGAG